MTTSLWSAAARVPGSDIFNPLPASLIKQANERPAHLAFVWTAVRRKELVVSDEFSYGVAVRRVRAVARQLSTELKLSKGNRVALCFPPGPEFVIAFLGCLYSGVVAVPVYPPEPAKAVLDVPRMCNILEKADVGAVLTTAWYKGIRRFIRSRDVRWDRLEWTALSSEEDEGDLPPCHVSPEDLAFLQFTSGSTSMPKGVMITHGSLLQNSHLCLSVFGLECTTPSGHVTLDDAPLETMLQRMQIMQTEWEVSKGHRGRGFSWLPFYHDMGLVGFVVTPLIFGGTAYMMSPVDFIKFPESWLQGLSMFKAQLTAGPNFAFELVCRKIRPEKLASLDLSEVSGILCGAEPIIPKVMHEFLKVFAACGLHSKAIRPAFGLAENTLIVTGSPRRDFPIVSLAINPESLDTGEVDVLLEWPLTSKQSVQSEGMVLTSCGVVLQTNQLAIVKDERSLPPDRVGEIWIQGGSLAMGYFNCGDEGFNRHLGHEGGWFATGDLGFLHNDHLFVCGRLKDMLIVNGRNFAAYDVERKIQADVCSLRPGCLAVFPLSGLSGVGFAGELKDEYVSWVGRFLQSEQNDEALRRIARDVAVSVRAGFGVDVQKVWLLWPRTIPKTSSGKIRRAVAAKMLETGDSAIIPRLMVDLPLADVGETAEVAEFPVDAAVSYSLLSPTSTERMWLGRPSDEGLASRVTALENAAVDVLIQCLSRVSTTNISLPEDDAPLYTSLALSSIEAVQLVAELENALDVAIPQTFLFEHPTMGEVRRQLALMLARQAVIRGEGGEDVLAALEEAAVVAVPKELADKSICRFAVVAVDLRLPGNVRSLSDMQRIFVNRLDPVTECPMGWDSSHYDPCGDFYTREGGFVDIEFNPSLVPPAEAFTLDPQQKRLLLSCHRLMARVPDAGSRVGVFVASSSNEWTAVMPRTESAFMATATSPSLMSNRVSFSLGLTGPSMTIDTACSSSLVAMDAALRSLRASQCDMAIIGASNSLMDSQVSRVLCKAGMLASHGRCRAFDSSAEGYVRSEACVTLAVVPLSSHIVRASQVLAIVESSHVNHGGTAAGLTVPSSQQQAACIRSAASAVPQVDYLETHGTGTALGDPLEVAGISQAFERRELPLVLGAAKSYFGHAEGAAGLVGVCAAVVALNTGYVPSPLHYERLNSQVRLPTWAQLGTEGANIRSAGVSSFGFGGTNAHVVLSAPSLPADLSEPPSAVVSTREKRAVGHPLLGALTPLLGRAYYLRLDVAQLLSHLCLRDQAVLGWGFLLDVLFSFVRPADRIANVRFADLAPIPDSLTFASNAFVPTNVPCPALTFEQLQQRRRDCVGLVTSEETVQGARTLQVMGFTTGHPSRRPLCVASVRQAPVSLAPAPPLEVDALNSLAPDALYAKLAARGIHLKAGYRRIASCFLSTDVIICELRTLELFEGDDHFALDPVSIDLALVSCLMLVNGAATSITSVRLETTRLLSTFRCERLSDMKCRVDLYDEDDRAVVSLGEVAFRPLTPPKAPMYRLSFKPTQVSSFKIPPDFLFAKLCQAGLVGSDESPLTLGVEDKVIVVVSPDANLSALDGILVSKMVVVSNSPLLWHPPTSAVGLVVCPLGSSIPSPDLVVGRVWRLQNGMWEVQTREPVLGRRIQFQSLPPDYVRVASLTGGGAVVTESNSDVEVGTVVDASPLTSVMQALPAETCTPLDRPQQHSADTLLIAGLPPDVSDVMLEFAVMMGWRHVRLLDAEPHGRCSRSLSSAFDIQQADSAKGTFMLCYCSLSFYLKWLPAPSVVLHPVGTALHCPLPHPVSLLQYNPGVHRHDLLNALSLLKTGVHTMSPLQPSTASITHSHKLSASRPLREQISEILLAAAVTVSGREDLEPNEVFGDAVDSLATMEFRERVSESIGIEVPMSALFDHPTLELLTSYLETIVCPAPQTAPVPTRASPVDPPCIAAFSLRLPGGVFDAESFWNMLTSPSDCRSLVPLSRFNVDSVYNADRAASGSSYVRHAAFAPYMDRFCPEHFGVNSLELQAMDPQHRVALTLALSCLASNRRLSASGFPTTDELYCNEDVLALRETFMDQDIGVFIGSCNPDWHYMPNNHDTRMSSAYSCVGGSQGLIANRVSHTFGLRGPSQTVDAACASSLVALADACDSIAAGRCSGALVGGVNLLLAPQVFVGFSRTQVLSPDGACKSFSADADGYGRGEGASMMLILPLSRAAALGYRPLGLVSGWAVTHSGRSTSMTAPSAKGQERAMRGALSMAGIDPADVGVIETHGTGTVLGDAIEAEAIAAVYGDRDSPITLASLKSRVGHGEGNAGAAGVLKAAMMLDQVSITPNANFSEWNPNLPKGVEWRVPLETTPLVSEHIGVSAFGFGGVNAHVIISKAPKTDVNSSASSPVRTQQEAICPQVLLVFAGQGSQHPGMLHDAYGSCGPRLASLIRHAQTIIGKDAMEAIWSSSTDAKDPLLQMGLLLVQLAQAETIMAEEIPVAAVVGHSLGELTLAAFVGAITADEAIRLLWSRIRLLHSTAEGRMVVLRRTLSEVKSAIDAAGVGVSIGAVNSATSVVLSGSSEEVDLVVKALHNDSPLLYKDLNVSHAFHSDLMEPVKEQFAAACREILEETNITSNILTISTVTGTRVDPTVFRTAAHWTNQLTSTVLFKDAVDTAARLLTGRPILPVELGIRPILTSLLRELLPLTKPVAFSGRQALDKLTLALTPSVKGVHDLLDPRHQPRHPWTPQDHPMYQTGLAPLYLRDDQVKVLMDHRVQFEALLPASQWVDLAVSLTRHLGYRGLQRVVILRPTKLQLPRPGREPPMQLRFQLREDVLEVSCRETESKREDVVMSARMSSSPVDSFAETLAAVRRRLEPLDLHMEAFYTELAEAGLQYGPHFRCLSSVLANQERTEFLSLIEAPSCAVSWTESDWLTGVAVDPRMLDASLHPLALMNLLSKMDMQNGQALLPAEFRGVVAFAPLPLRLLSHVTLLEVERPKPVQTVEPPRSVSVKLDLRSEEGQLLLRIERLSLRRVDMKPKVTPITRMLWSEELQSFSPAVECVEGVYSVGVYPTCDFRPFQSPEELQAATCLLYRVENVSDVLKLVGLLKALRDLNLSSSLVIWVVEEFGGGIGRGFVRSARLELQRLLPHVILKHYEGPDQGLHLVLASPEADVVFRDNTYFGRRLHQIPAEILHPKSLVLGDRGSINSLEPRPQAVAARRKPTGTAVEVRVMAVGLNFRDVLNVLGLYPGQPGPPGADFAGVVTRTGEAAGVEVGEKVYGLAPGCLQPFTITDSRCIRSMPPSLDFQRACCLPIAAVTVEYAFADLAKVQMGDTVLVHAVTGAVGVMALQYCQRVGAVCIGTAGSEYKRSKALELGVAFVSSSRDADTFIKGTRQWLESEDRDGVDVVLNSLIGEFIPYSLSLLKSGGRFVELGKRENWSADAIERQFPNVKHHVVAVDTLSDDNPEWMGSMLDRVSEEVGKRNIIPLPMHVTSIYSESHGLDAFRHLQRAQHIGKVVITFDSPFSGGTVLVSGGFGALGGVLVRWAADEGVRHFILIGRSSRHPSFDHLKVHCVKADVANFEQFQRALEARPADFPPVTSIFHLAGVLDDRPLFDITSESLEFTMQPKVMGFQNLDRLSRSWPVKNFVVFSSVAAVLGNTSQVNYGISNAVMEELAAGRRADGLSCAVVQWGPWTDQGMATAFAPLLDSTGLLGIDNERALRCLQHILQYRSSQTTLVQPIGWTNFCSSRRYDQINMPTFLANEVAEGLKADQTQVIHVAVDDSLLQMTPEERGVFVADLVRNTAAKIVGCPAESLSMSVPVVESGIDSLGAVEFGSILSKVLGVSMGPTILFDYPTLADITSYLQGELECLASSASKSTTPTKTRESSGTSRSSDHDNTTRYAIVGMSCRMPKDVADPDTFWKTLLQGKDCVGPVPDARFNLDAIYDADPAAPNCTYATEAGFMKEIDLFDRGFFRLSEEEVSLMDPQQRMLLEMLVDCGTDAGLITDADTLSSANTLKGSNWGVFVGLCNADWLYTSAVDQCNSTFSSTGAAHCMASNRISYLLGLKGPSMTIDTACSSSLVALNVALSTMNADPSIEGCFVGGVNLMLTPHPFVSFAKTRMLSPDNRCKAFDATANGYARGEGGGFVAIVSEATAQRLGLSYSVVVCGSAVNHDGVSASLTAPNGLAQQETIRKAWSNAGLSPTEALAIECHGTGTALGDPVEALAIKAVCRPKGCQKPLSLMTVKTHIGHLEGGAGIAGVIKAALCLEKRSLVPNLHFSKLNPHIDFDGALIEVCTSQATASIGSAVGVSSFGFGGANAHAVLQSVPGCKTHHVVREWRRARFPWADFVTGFSSGLQETVHHPPSEVRHVLLEHLLSLAQENEASDVVAVVLGLLDSDGSFDALSEFRARDTLHLWLDSLALVTLRDQIVTALDAHGRLAMATFFDHEDLGALLTSVFNDVTTLRRPTADIVGIPKNPEAGDLVVVGVGVRLPHGVSSLSAFWDFVNRDPPNPQVVPTTRFETSRLRSTVPGMKGFLISDKAHLLTECQLNSLGLSSDADPHQFLAVEVCKSALLMAGIQDESTSMHLGCADTSEWSAVQLLGGGSIGAPKLSSSSLIPSAVGLALGTTGVCTLVDTGCASFATALEGAMNSVSTGKARYALAVGISLLLTPLTLMAFSERGLLSPSGVCRPFDEAMDGTVRGEGGVAVLITSRRQAREKGLLILGALSEVTSAQGTVRTADFGFSGTALTRCLRQANTSNLAHIECHGSGILVADVMEAEAIAACTTIRTMSSTHPHFGHGNAALAGVQFVKALLVRAFNRIPATGNFTHPHPLVDAAVPDTVVSRETSLLSGFDVGLHAIGMGGACYYIGLRDEGVELEALSRLLQREPDIGPVPDSCRWRPPKPLLLEALARSLTKITASTPTPSMDLKFVGAPPKYGLDSIAFSGDVSVESLVTVGLYLRCTSHIIFVIEDQDWLTRGTALLKILQVALIPPNSESRLDRLCSLDADRDFDKLTDLNITLLSARIDQLPYSVRQFENRPLAGVRHHRDLVLCNIVASLLGVTCNPICDYTDAGLFDVCSEFALLVYSGLFLGAMPTGADVAVRAWGTHGPGPVKRLPRSTVASLASRLGLCVVDLLPPTEYLAVFAQKDQSLRFIPALVAMKRLVSGAFTSDLTGAAEITADELFWIELLVRKVLVIVHKTDIIRRLELPELVDFLCLAMPSTPAWQMDILAEYNALDCSHLSTAGRFALSTIFSFGTRTVAAMEKAETETTKSSKQLLLVAGTDRQALNELLRILEADSRLLLPSIAELLCLSPSPLTRWAIQGVWQVMSEPMKALLPTSCLLGWETTLLLECVGLCPSIGMKFGLFPHVTFEDSLPAQAFLRRWISYVAATSTAEIVVIASPYLHTAMDWECFAGVIDLVGESNPSLNDTIQTSFRKVTIKPERTPGRPPSQRFIRDILPPRRSLKVAGSEFLRNPILFYASTIAYFGLQQDFQSMLDVCRVCLRGTLDLAELSKRADMTSVLESLAAIPEAQRNLLSALAHHITFDLDLSRLECMQAIKTLLPQTGQPLLDAELLYERCLALLDGVAERPTAKVSDAQSVVITGATGFLGTFLLHHLLNVGLHTFFGSENVTIFCITRGANRLPRSFAKFGLDCPDLRNVEEMPVESSIDMANLGLSDAQWERLCSSPPGPIIHLAAAVDLVGCYNGLKTVNVWPLLEVLRLSISHRYSTRPLIFAGSLGIFPQFVSTFMDVNSVQLGPPQERAHEVRATVYENDFPSATLMHQTLSEHLYGYGWTKWVCERVLALLSRERVAPRVLVWRFGHIGYSKSTGYSNTADPVFRMIDGLRKAMVLPLPADAVCSGRALMESFLSTAGATILTSVDDAARLAARSLRWLQSDDRYDVVHICQNVADIRPGALKTSQRGGFLWIGDETNMVPLKIIRLDEITDYMPLPLKGPAAVYQTLYFHSLSGTREAVHEVSRSNLERLVGHVEWSPFNISRLLKMSSRGLQTSAIGARFATAPLVPGTTNRYYRRLGVEGCDILARGFQDIELSMDRLKRANAMLIHYLRNLAFMEKAESDFPEILTQSIHRPVIILGLNRSGTSFMLNLLNSLNGLSAPLLGELTTPYGLRGELSTDSFSDGERLEAQTAGGTRFLSFQNVGEALAQEWDEIHAQRPDLPEEDFLIFEHILRSFSIYCVTGAECYLEWLFADDRLRLREAYDFHRAFIAHLQHVRTRGGAPTPRWLLKQPFHLFCVDTLLQMYPDCQIIALTRDFDQVLRSWGALLRNVRQRFHGCPVNMPRETELLRDMADGLESLRGRPNVRFVEYSRLIREPMSVLSDVCAFLDVPLDHAAAEDFLRRDAARRGHRV